MRRLAAVCLMLLGLAACEQAQHRAPRPIERPRLDKRALYGDAALLPTREGERIRRELALAGELERALVLLGLDEVRVDIELGEAPQVIVIARVLDHGDRAELAATIDELGRALVPGQPDVHVELIEGTPPTLDAPATPEPARTWALAIVCLGLGASLGVTGERLLARRRRVLARQSTAQ